MRHNLPLIDRHRPGRQHDRSWRARTLTAWTGWKRARWSWKSLPSWAAARDRGTYDHNVGYSQRSHVPIEPYLSEQWFLKYPSVEKARACVEQAEEGLAVPSERGAQGTAAYQKMRFHPQRWARSTTTGWATSRTGASAASFGGDIGCRCGRARRSAKSSDKCHAQKHFAKLVEHAWMTRRISYHWRIIPDCRNAI